MATLMQRAVLSPRAVERPGRRAGCTRRIAAAKPDRSRRAVVVAAAPEEGESGGAGPDKDKDLVSEFARKTAGTFAPRGSGPQKKNPAYPGTYLARRPRPILILPLTATAAGSALYTIFEVQAYASIVAGALLSYNVIFPSNEPDLWRLMGMWSVWAFAIPSLRARDCPPREKDALNVLFILVPLINITIPIFWRSFAAVYTADVVVMAAVYAYKLLGPAPPEPEENEGSS